MWKDLTQEQKTRFIVENDEAELLSVTQGVERYHRSAQHSDLKKPEKAVIIEVLDEAVFAIRKDQESLLAGLAMAGRPQTWAPAYVTMSAEKLAIIALRRLLRIDYESMKMCAVAMHIAREVQLEHEHEEIIRVSKVRSKTERGFSKVYTDRLRRQPDKVKKVFKRMHGKTLRWTPTQKIGIGSRILLVLANAGIGCIIELTKQHKKKVYMIRVMDHIIQAMLQYDSAVEILKPATAPMHCPPTPWTQEGNTFTGGYRVGRTDIMRLIGQSENHRYDFTNHPIPHVLKAVNAIQAVEWEVDTRTLVSAERVLKMNDKQWDSLIPSVHPKVYLPWPKGELTKGEKKVLHQARDVAELQYTQALNTRIAAQYAVSSARRTAGKPIFFVQHMDWRGRVYPSPCCFTPQGTDLQKALLLYAERVPLGPNGMRNLKIWAAGCAGEDKVSFDDRVKWYDENWGRCTNVDYEMERWADYDNPFLFAQAVREITGAIKSGNPSKFLSNVSVCRDGSQNGLQHLSAMGRDPVGGPQVNLEPSPKPMDLYARVAEVVAVAVTGDAEEIVKSGKVTDECDQTLPALSWLEDMQVPKTRRKIVKRSVLAYPYGISKAGIRDGLIADGMTDGLPGSKHRNAWYMADKVVDAVKDVVVNAAIIMEWMQSCANTLGEQGKPIEWTTPSGFICRMSYRVDESKRIDTNGIGLCIKIYTDEINRMKQVRGIVANFVHSLDASHLINTVNASSDGGIVSSHWVHDSYGCHAGKIDHLSYLLRREFVDMYTEDILMGLSDVFQEMDPTLPLAPSRGALDITKVLDSEYFFG